MSCAAPGVLPFTQSVRALAAEFELQVLGATPACTTLTVPGTVAPGDFQIMLKKSGMPLQNSFTVVSALGALDCNVASTVP